MRAFHSLGVALLLAGGSPGTALAQGAAPAAADALDPAKLAVAQEIIRIGFPPADRAEMMQRASEAMIAQMRAAVDQAAGGTRDPGMQQIMDRYLERVRAATRQLNTEGAPAIFAAMARAYARNFTMQELVDIRAFLSTPSGRNYLRRSMDMLSDPDVAAANRAHMTHGFRVMQPLMDDFRREVDAYVRSHRPRG